MGSSVCARDFYPWVLGSVSLLRGPLVFGVCSGGAMGAALTLPGRGWAGLLPLQRRVDEGPLLLDNPVQAASGEFHSFLCLPGKARFLIVGGGAGARCRIGRKGLGCCSGIW